MSGSARRGLAFLAAFGLAAVGVGLARGLTTTYVPVLLERIDDNPGLIGAVMLVNAVAGFGVPLAVGVWSDRVSRGRFGRRLPFVLGGTLLTAGGMVAIALGTGSSYAYLALAAAAVYVGLNAAATAHRTIVAEGFDDEERPAGTSSQEVAMLLGGMLGLLAGGVLIDSAPWLLFLLAALVLPLLAAPTAAAALRRTVPREPEEAAPSEQRVRPRDLADAMRHPGAREVLVGQILWVAAYGALPAFFFLYAERTLELGAGPASALIAGFGIATGLGMLAAGRVPAERVYRTLVRGALLLGAGLLAAAAFADVVSVLIPFAVAAVGAGIVTALGFPYFARFIPAGRSGGYTGVFFAVRAIGTASALPLAGGLIAWTDSYRSVLLLGGFALLAPLSLALAERRRRPAPARAPRPLGRVAAVVPVHFAARLEAVVAATLEHVDEVVVVRDGSPPADAATIDRVAQRGRVRLVALDPNAGKGDAVAAGVEALLAGAERPDAVVVLDADGQHRADRIPAFVAAGATADVVIGDRSDDRGGMPWTRRFTNATSSVLLGAVLRRRVPDSQCGMRLYRTEVLERVPPPPGRYEAETHHLKALVRAGAVPAWVPIPAIYDGAESSFRPVRDTARVLRAIVGRPPRAREQSRPDAGFARTWAIRLGAVVAGTLAVGILMPLYGALDERAFVSINSLGAGPEWLYEALDPHTRNYILVSVLVAGTALLVRPRAAIGAAVAVTLAALFSDVLVQAVYLLHDRPRPEEVLGAQALLATPERTWAHIASFPSGHLVVTTAIAVAGMSIVPQLRGVLWAYVGLIALTRITFGAHFPLDVAAGLVFGYVCGRFSAALLHAYGRVPGGLAPALPSWRAWHRRPAVTGPPTRPV